MKTIYLIGLILVFALGAYAQTVDVPGTYATIQEAINSFSGDVTPDDNVVRITTVGPYAEVITLTYPVTIRGDVGGGERPIILAQDNAGDGIVVNNGSPYNRLENLIILPDRTSTPIDDGVWVTGSGTVCHFDNVLICPNNGSDQPVSTDGLSLPDLTGATFFGDELIYVNSDAIVHLTDTILTANVAPGTGHRGVTAFLLDRDDAGLSFGEPMRKMGQRAIISSELFLDEVCVAADRRLGQEGDGFRGLMQTFDRSRVTLGASATGLARAAGYRVHLDGIAFGHVRREALPTRVEQAVRQRLGQALAREQAGQQAHNRLDALAEQRAVLPAHFPGVTGDVHHRQRARFRVAHLEKSRARAADHFATGRLENGWRHETGTPVQ